MAITTDIIEIKKLFDAGPLFRPASQSQLQAREDEEDKRHQDQQDAYQKTRTEQEASRERKKQVAQVTMKKVMTLLGMGDVRTSEWGDVYGKNQAGEEIHLSYSNYGRGADFNRIKVSGNYPKARGENTHRTVYGDDRKEMAHPSMTVSAEKSPELIAKDITRRFLPAHKDYHTRSQAGAKEADTYEDETITALELVKGEKLSDYELQRHEISHGTFRGEHTYGKVSASGSSVRVEISGLTPQQAKAIVDIANQGV